MAGKDSVRVRNAQGLEFLISPADESVSEVELLRQNHDSLPFWTSGSRSANRSSLQEIEDRLAKENGDSA